MDKELKIPLISALICVTGIAIMLLAIFAVFNSPSEEAIVLAIVGGALFVAGFIGGIIASETVDLKK